MSLSQLPLKLGLELFKILANTEIIETVYCSRRASEALKQFSPKSLGNNGIDSGFRIATLKRIKIAGQKRERFLVLVTERSSPVGLPLAIQTSIEQKSSNELKKFLQAKERRDASEQLFRLRETFEEIDRILVPNTKSADEKGSSQKSAVAQFNRKKWIAPVLGCLAAIGAMTTLLALLQLSRLSNQLKNETRERQRVQSDLSKRIDDEVANLTTQISESQNRNSFRGFLTTDWYKSGCVSIFPDANASSELEITIRGAGWSYVEIIELIDGNGNQISLVAGDYEKYPFKDARMKTKLAIEGKRDKIAQLKITLKSNSKKSSVWTEIEVD